MLIKLNMTVQNKKLSHSCNYLSDGINREVPPYLTRRMCIFDTHDFLILFQ